jgi:glutamate-ammonia-ligase adenylyltransferase
MHADSQNPALEFSPFLNQLVTRYPEWLDELRAEGRLENTAPPSAEILARAIDAHGLDSGLRRFRNQEMMRLIWRDLNQLATVDEILGDLSKLAEVCLQATVGFHTGLFEEKYGKPINPEGLEQKLVVIGLGKLGGYELNLSSDIDIIFCYPEGGACDGRRGLSNEQFFTRHWSAALPHLSSIINAKDVIGNVMP